jgi:glucose/arabinose dehydrogenase
MIRLGLAAVLALQLGVAFWGASPTTAQAARTVVASGLDAPRGIAFGPDGRMYVAEAGTGGDEQVEWVPPFRSARVGTSGRITRIDGGQKSVVASDLQSLALGPGSEIVGVHDLAFVGSTLYALVGQMNALPGGRETQSLLVRIGPDGRAETVADLGRFERENNPDQTIPDSNPYGLTAGPDGNLYVADAGGNDALRVTPGGQVSVFAVWRDNPVPTGMAFDSSGRAHVSFLSGNPFAKGTARVERVSIGGTEVAVPNLTTVVDLAFAPDGSLYVLELGERLTDPPPPRFVQNTGRVLRVTPTGTQVALDGLNFPTKLAFGPDGALYVTNNATFVPPGSGEILRVSVSGAPAAPAAPAPAAPAPALPGPIASPAPARPATAPVQAPRALPRTGAAPDLAGTLAPVAASGTALLLAGLALRRRRG